METPTLTPGLEAHAARTIEYVLNGPTGIVEHCFESPALHRSDELYRIHGDERGEVLPALDLGISHVEFLDTSHFELTDRNAGRFQNLLSNGGPLSAYLSLRDVDGRARRDLIPGDYILKEGEHGSEPTGVRALVVDPTSSIHADTHRLADEAFGVRRKTWLDRASEHDFVTIVKIAAWWLSHHVFIVSETGTYLRLES